MYEIRPESVKSFITDKNIRLPRFQRKQTWDEKKNFELCISLFKEYPLGVTIVNVEKKDGINIRWLLDGRQRRNALVKLYEDPDNIYKWAKNISSLKIILNLRKFAICFGKQSMNTLNMMMTNQTIIIPMNRK